MKQLFTVMALGLFCTVSAQTSKDSIRVGNMIIVTKGEKKTSGKEEKEVYTMAKVDTTGTGKQEDTIQVGNILIVTNGEKDKRNSSYEEYGSERRNRSKPSNVSTNWIILDLGFSNYVNNTTDYSNAGTGGYLYNRPGAAPFGENDFELSTGKSINVNIWLFMQRLNLVKHHLHLKYGLGIELNNYRYKSQVSYLKENPFVTGVAPAPVIFRDTIAFSKNKLATDYITVPLMLNYSTNPYNQRRGFSISLGVSAGYLYSQRNKQVSDQRGTQKATDGIGIKQFKFSYIGEIGLGPVRLYGSYSPTSFYKKGLDMRPYTLGIRLSNW